MIAVVKSPSKPMDVPEASLYADQYEMILGFGLFVVISLGLSQAWLSKKLGLSQAAKSLSVARGRKIASQKKYEIGNL